MKSVCVIGLGYIGLPTAAMFASSGLQVLGVDTNPAVLAALRQRHVPIGEPGLEQLVSRVLQDGNLQVATEPAPADAFVICVPTPCCHGPIDGPAMADLRYVIAAAEAVVPHLRPGCLVVLESTVPPRTVEDVLVPILERSWLKVADAQRRTSPVDVLVAHCPERVLPGHILEELVHNERVIGGMDPASAQAAQALYASFVRGKMHLTDATTAEMVKLMENTYRDVNIALANEFALVAEQVGIDIWQAIELANCHPRVRILKPGPGVGGHCIAVDPWFMVQAAPAVTPLIQTARRVNDSMPLHVVELTKRAIEGIDRPKVACLGLAYKANVGDVRESPAVKVVEMLQAEGVTVRAYDPHVPPATVPGQVQSMAEALVGVDAVLVLTDHSAFADLSVDRFGGQCRLVLDTRHCLQETNVHLLGKGPSGAKPVCTSNLPQDE